MKKLVEFCLVVVGGILLVPFFAFAYDTAITHPALTNEIIDLYNSRHSGETITEEERGWILEGSVEEDVPPRWINHFYDPINKVGWTGEGMKNISSNLAMSFSKFALSFENPVSVISWAKDYNLQEEFSLYGGNNSWKRGIEFYAYDANKEKAYVALGHILHLLEDMGVPDHTRDDTHADVAESITGDTESPYETYAIRWDISNIKKLDISGKIQKDGASIPQNNSFEAYFLSLADYSNKYFFSKDTIDKYDLPKVVHEDNEFGYGKDETGKYFPLVFLSQEKNGSEFTRKYSLEDRKKYTDIFDAYFTRLSKQIVLNGTGLMELFVRQAKDEVVNKEFPDVAKTFGRASHWLSIPTISFFGEIDKLSRSMGTAFISVGSIFGMGNDAPPETEKDKDMGENDLGIKDDDYWQEKIEEIQENIREERERSEKPTRPGDEENIEISSVEDKDIDDGRRFGKRDPLAENPTKKEEKISRYDSRRTIALASNYTSAGGGGDPASAQEDVPIVDAAAPSAIDDLRTTDISTSSLKLLWTAPGDDGRVGRATSYQIRYSTNPLTAENWMMASEIVGTPTPGEAGVEESFILTGLVSNTQYYFGVKSSDEIPNVSSISNVASATTNEINPENSNVNHLLISEFQVAGVDAGDEFIEIYNPTDRNIDISSWSIQYLSGTAESISSVKKKNFADGSAVPARGYFLIGRGLDQSGQDGYKGSVQADISQRTFSMSHTGGTVFLVGSDQNITGSDDLTIIDSLNYGAIALGGDGWAVDPPGNGKSLERKAWSEGDCMSAQSEEGQFKGNGCDTDNMQDLQIRDIPFPQNSSSFGEPRSTPGINNFRWNYSSSTMNVQFDWDYSNDFSGATSTNEYFIYDNSSDPSSVIFNSTSTNTFSQEIYQEKEFKFTVRDKDGLSNSTTTRITADFFSFRGTIFEQAENSSVAPVGLATGAHYFWQTFSPQKTGLIEGVSMEWADSVIGIGQCDLKLYRADSYEEASEGNLLGAAYTTYPEGNTADNIVYCISADYSFNSIPVDAGENYILIFRFTNASNQPYIKVGSDQISGRLGTDTNLSDNVDLNFRLNGIVKSDKLFDSAPTAPADLTADLEQAHSRLKISWSPSSDPDSPPETLKYQLNFSTSSTLDPSAWGPEVDVTEGFVPLVYPNTYKIGVRAIDNFRNISEASIIDWNFPSDLSMTDQLVSQTEPVGAYWARSQNGTNTNSFGQTFKVISPSIPYKLKLKTQYTTGGVCSVSIYETNSIDLIGDNNLIASSDVMTGSDCDASLEKEFQFATTNRLDPGVSYVWVYKVERSSASGAGDGIGMSYKEEGFGETFFRRQMDTEPQTSEDSSTFNAYFELLGDLQ